jgi:hypothetical protein
LSPEPGTITTIAGTGKAGYAGDGGPAAQAELNYSLAVAYDASGSLYIADAGNHRVRKVDPNGTITTLCGRSISRRTSAPSPVPAAPAPQGTGVRPLPPG